MAWNKIWEETFSGTLSNWTTSGGNVAIATLDNDEKMRLTSVANSSEYAERSISEPATDEFIIETDLYYSADAGFLGVVELLDASNNVLIQASFNSGNLSIDTDADTSASIAFPAADYRQLIITIDRVNDLVRFYLSDADGGWGNWDLVGSAKSYSGTTVSKIKFRTSTTGSMRVDEVCVYSPDWFCIGDSIMDGKPNWSAKPNWQARTATTENELAAPAYQLELLSNTYIANRAFGGSNSTGINAYIQKLVIDQFAKRVVIHIGHNDLYSGSNLATLKTNITAISDKLIAGGITGDNVTFCPISPSDLFEGTPANDESDRIEFNRWLISFCAQRGHRISWDYAALNDNTNTPLYKRLAAAYDDGDGTHLNQAGSTLLAQSIFDARVPGGVLRPARASSDIRLYPADYLNYSDVLPFQYFNAEQAGDDIAAQDAVFTGSGNADFAAEQVVDEATANDAAFSAGGYFNAEEVVDEANANDGTFMPAGTASFASEQVIDENTAQDATISPSGPANFPAEAVTDEINANDATLAPGQVDFIAEGVTDEITAQDAAFTQGASQFIAQGVTDEITAVDSEFTSTERDFDAEGVTDAMSAADASITASGNAEFAAGQVVDAITAQDAVFSKAVITNNVIITVYFTRNETIEVLF